MAMRALAATLLQPYNAPDDERKRRHERINNACIELGGIIADECADCDQAREALYALVNARMWANHAIATVPFDKDSTHE